MYDYEAFYKKYPVNQHDQPERHSKVAELSKGALLDVGCGAGMLSDYYDGLYLGLDISFEAVKKAQEVRRKDARFDVRDCVDFRGFDFSHYDTIVMSEFLERIENDDLIFEPLKQTAKQGSRLIVTVPNGHAFDCDEHVRYFSVPELRRKLQPLGRVQFHNWPGAKGQIIATVELGEPARDLLSLVMIVKNEALGLERAILSAIQYVDNIVIAVDDSSTDKTLEIAIRYADHIKHFKWCDDFAGARNFAHAGVGTKWILFLDGHEYVEKCEHLDEFLNIDADGLLCSVELESGAVIRNPRIYQRGVHFEGAVHEKQICQKVIFYPDFLVKHDRMSGQSLGASLERDKQRDDQVPRIMGEQLKRNPRNLRALFHLALYFQSRGDFKQALKYQRKYLKYSTHKGERWYVLFNRALCLLALDRTLRAFWAVSAADSETPGRWEMSKMRGLVYYSQKRYRKAIDCFVDSFKINLVDQTYKPWQRDDGGTWNLIGESFFNLKEYHKAHIAFLEVEKNSIDVRFKELAGKRAALMFEMAKNFEK